MDHAQPAPRLMGAAAVACVSCRKLKMRCIGASNPPCARCLKNNRECVVRLPTRQQPRFPSPSKVPRNRHDHNSPKQAVDFHISPLASKSPIISFSPTESPSQARESTSPRTSSIQGQPQSNKPALPSIFSSSPMTITTGGESPPQIISASIHHSESDRILESVILDLVEFFVQRLLLYIPVLSLEPMDRLDLLLETRRPLAYAMAFVAANFAPGYCSPRRSLLPHMVRMVDGSNDIINNSPEANWTLLQALAVIYAYPQVTTESRRTGERRLSLWSVKSAVEACAMQMSLHQSIDDLNELVRSGGPDISTSLSYRRSFYWVWLFVKSRHHSIITRSPPTIHNDTTIISTVDLMMDLDPSPSVWRVLAEAALHHVWDQAAGSDKSLAEWWRIPSSTKDIGTLLGILENAESLLQQWRSTWLQPTEITTSKFLDSSSPDVSTFANSITSFMGTLTHFSIVSFATPVVSHQLAAKTGSASFYTTTSLSPELSSLLDCVLKSADAASKCCDTILNLKPTEREFLRYTPDFGFTMIALCCLHLVYAFTMSPDNLTLRKYLLKAEQVAHLLTDSAVACNTCPKIYGNYILLQLRSASRIPYPSVDENRGCLSTNNPHLNCSKACEEPHPLSTTLPINHPMYWGFESSLSPIGPTADQFIWPASELDSEDAMTWSHDQVSDLFNLDIYSDLALE